MLEYLGLVHSCRLGTFFFQPKIVDIFLISPQRQCFGSSLEAPHQGASYEYLQHMFLCRIKKNIFLTSPQSIGLIRYLTYMSPGHPTDIAL